MEQADIMIQARRAEAMKANSVSGRLAPNGKSSAALLAGGRAVAPAATKASLPLSFTISSTSGSLSGWMVSYREAGTLA